MLKSLERNIEAHFNQNETDEILNCDNTVETHRIQIDEFIRLGYTVEYTAQDVVDYVDELKAANK